MFTFCMTPLLATLLAFPPPFTEEEQDQEQANDELPPYQEVIVVSVSKLQEELVNAPATVSVLPSRVIERSPAQNYGDLLRVVPGLNVIQMSARDINLRSRAAASTLVTSQLALLDGRTIYQDFFGFVFWDLLPINTDEIKQIEIIRGPASAVWGANAMTGVVNVITKPPREMLGTTLAIDFGGFDRSVHGNDEDAGLLLALNGTYGKAVSERLAFKISAGFYAQHALPRPTGTIPNQFQTPYPPYPNQGTEQPKFDARFDYDFPTDGQEMSRAQKLVFAGGYAGTGGIVHSGIGPFAIKPETFLAYGSVRYQHRDFRLSFFTNITDSEAPALLAIGADGQPINFTFKNQTYDVELGNLNVIGDTHLLSYGGNVRHNKFDISLAPGRDNRDEVGLYIQDEIFLSDHFRWVVGGRIDKFDVLEDVVFSPRTSFMVKPNPDHTFRISFNRAFRAPSLVNNFMNTVILDSVDLGSIDPSLAGDPFVFAVAGLGNETLREESLTSYELGYTGVIEGRTIVSAAFYINEIDNLIQFNQTDTYDSTNPPPGWPLPPSVLDELSRAGLGLPAELSFRNLERVRDKGIELSVDTRIDSLFGVFANYSWQADPVPTGFDLSELNLPPTHRFNAGFSVDYDRFFGNVSVNFTDEAFWQDVLDARFHGPTDAYTLVNAGFGVRWEDGKLSTIIEVNNLSNSEIQQHVFGDIITRLIVGKLRFRF